MAAVEEAIDAVEASAVHAHQEWQLHTKGRSSSLQTTSEFAVRTTASSILIVLNSLKVMQLSSIRQMENQANLETTQVTTNKVTCHVHPWDNSRLSRSIRSSTLITTSCARSSYSSSSSEATCSPCVRLKTD